MGGGGAGRWCLVCCRWGFCCCFLGVVIVGFEGFYRCSSNLYVIISFLYNTRSV